MIWGETKITSSSKAGGLSYQGFELPRVKYSKRMKEIQERSILVRVSEGSSYWESTVVTIGIPKAWSGLRSGISTSDTLNLNNLNVTKWNLKFFVKCWFCHIFWVKGLRMFYTK